MEGGTAPCWAGEEEAREGRVLHDARRMLCSDTTELPELPPCWPPIGGARYHIEAAAGGGGGAQLGAPRRDGGMSLIAEGRRLGVEPTESLTVKGVPLRARKQREWRVRVGRAVGWGTHVGGHALVGALGMIGLAGSG